MSDRHPMNEALLLLQSKDHGQLLDVIDLLRSQGISHYVPLPQLIVCGDQSSGKSSVLEAVSGVRFPIKDTLCTRFVTELILRRGPTANATAAILPGSERSVEEKEKLLGFKAPTVQIDEFPSLVRAAEEAMGLDSNPKDFSDDILRVEILGPEQPHLSLVDIPGLTHAENKQQSANSVHLVSSLNRKYMASTRSIILAVVSAKNDYANQIVTTLAREVDPKGLRTLGIITKPDTLHVGSESETAYLNLGKNEDVVFRLGWHVLMNRDFDTRECPGEERDRRERDFFSQGIWTSLSASSMGIGALKPRLSTVLKDQITSELPSLIRDVQAGIDDCRRRLSRLGEARSTPQEQLSYLVHVSQSFSSLVEAAVNGVYVHEFFGSAMTDVGFSKRLRARIQVLLTEFAKAMRCEGQHQEIIEEASAPNNVRVSKQISRSEFVDDVCRLMTRSRGCELPGTFNPLIVGDLFFEQSRPWKQIVDRFSERILDAIRNALELILSHTTDEATCEGLLRQVINPAMEAYTERLGRKIAEITRPHQRGHPITYNHHFTETIQRARQDHAKKYQARHLNAFFKMKPEAGPSDLDFERFNTGKLLDALNQQTEADMDRYAGSEATDCMEAYYKVALKVVVDNFAVLGIEHCLLDGLSKTFVPDTVMNLDDNSIRTIAAETEEYSHERILVTKKLKSLEEALQTLNRLARQSLGADRLGGLTHRPEVDHEVTVSEVDAGTKGERVEEQKNPFAEDVSSPNAAERESHEPTISHLSVEDEIHWSLPAKSTKRFGAYKKKKRSMNTVVPDDAGLENS
ncbi:MAG: hypothetical protein M1837_005373 [Sclerophora amabilis]|nr:MAG: hypothetical protein M1837_005373 [Sclerophora amabilis]